MQPSTAMPPLIIYIRGIASAAVTGATAAGPVYVSSHSITVLVIAAFLTGFAKGLVDVFSPSPAQESNK